MQPQGPQSPQSGPYPPYNPGPAQGAQPAIPGQPQAPYQPPVQSGTGYPGGPAYPAQSPAQPVQTVQPGQISAPQLPSSQVGPQQAMPQYQMPKNLQQQAPRQEMLPPAPDAATTPYDFFMQPKPATPTTPLPISGRHFGTLPGSRAQGRTGIAKWFPFIAAGGVAIVLILGLAVVLSPKDTVGPQLFSVAQTQQEVARLCTQGSSKAKYRSTRNFAITCSTAVKTNQSELMAYMQKQKLEYNPKQIDAKASGTVSAQLSAAESSSNYDDTFRGIMQEQLEAYNSKLTSQLGITTGANARAVLTKSQTANELLIQMVRDNSDKSLAAPDPSGS